MALESFGGIEPPRYSVRGSGLQSAPTSRGIALRWDGLPLGFADGSAQAFWIAPGLTAGGSLLRGAPGVAAGGCALGGVLDLRGVETGVGQTAALAVGTGGYWTLSGIDRGDAAGRTLLAAVQAQGTDGFRETNDHQQRLMANARLRTTNGEISFLGGRTFYEVPGPLTLAALAARPESVSAEVERDRPRRHAAMGRLGGRWFGGTDTAGWSAGASWMHHRDDFRMLQANGQNISNGDDVGVTALGFLEFAGAPLPQRLVVQANAIQGIRRWERFGHFGGVRLERFASDSLAAGMGSVSAVDSIRIGEAGLLRLGWVGQASSRRVADALNGGRILLKCSQGCGLPQATFAWNPVGREWGLHAGGYTGAEAPTFDDLLVTEGRIRRIRELATQRAKVFEAGTHGRLGSWRWDACAHSGRWDGELLRLAGADGATRGTVNAGATIHEGVEIALGFDGARTAPRLQADFKGIWQSARFDGDPVRGMGRLGGVPPWTGRGVVTAEGKTGWRASLEGIFVAGSTAADHGGRLSYGGHSLWSVRLGRRTARLGWHLGVANVLGRNAVASTAGIIDIARNPTGTALFLPVAPRSWAAGLDWRH